MDRTRPRAWRALVRSESASRARIARALVLGSPARRPASAQAAAPPALVPGRSCPASVPGPSPSPSRAALARAASVINRRPGSLRRARCPRRGLVGRSIPAALPSIRAAMMLAQAKAEAGARPHGLPPPASGFAPSGGLAATEASSSPASGVDRRTRRAAARPCRSGRGASPASGPAPPSQAGANDAQACWSSATERASLPSAQLAWWRCCTNTRRPTSTLNSKRSS